MLSQALYKLKDFFKDNPAVALCFSGGVNSAFLLYFGLHYGANMKAYYVKTAFQPKSELEDAIRIAQQLGVNLSVLKADILSVAQVAENSEDRCYSCKYKLISTIKRQAEKDGFTILIDGTNMPDDAKECYQKKALTEFSVRSPLKECHISKTKVRMLSKKAGLFTWNKPAYSCLATRVQTGIYISAEMLRRIERAERELFEIGFTDFRVGIVGRTANLRVPISQMETAVEKRERILECLKPDFDSLLLDLTGR